MFKLILEHEYTKPKPAVDTSRFIQHGTVINALHSLDGRIAGSGAMQFLAPNSAVRVPVSSSWMNLDAIAVQIWLKLDGLPGQRQNLIEGDNSFALFIDSDGSVVASFLGLVQGQSTMQWNSVSTAIHSPSGVAVTLQPGVWSFISVVFDRFGRTRVWIDEALAGVRTDFTVGVKSVEAAGIVIGNWTLSNQYALNGSIDSVRVWKEDPVAPIIQFVSRLRTKSERQAWDRFFDCLARSNPDRLGQYAELSRELEDIQRSVIAGLYNASEAEREEFLALLRAYLDAWAGNSISSSEHIATVLTLQKLMDLFSNNQFSERLRQLVDQLLRIFESEKGCLDQSGIAQADPEFVSFIQQATAQIEEA
jgi:hypothetical protein